MKRKNWYFRPWLAKTLEIVFITLVLMLLCLDDFTPNLATFAVLGAWVGTIILLYHVLARHSREFQKMLKEMKEDDYQYGD